MILSSTKQILAINHGLYRLLGRSSSDTVVGTNVHDLGVDFARQPGSKQTGWDSLLNIQTNPVEHNATNYNNTNSHVESPWPGATSEFWDQEDKISQPTVDVRITRPQSAGKRPGDKRKVSDRIRAQMCSRRIQLDDQVIYLVDLQRPTSQPILPPNRSDESIGHDDSMGPPNGDERIVLPEDSSDQETQVHRIVSTAIPYFTALFDAQGEAVHLSSSWHRVTGRGAKESLGSRWFEAFHPDDRAKLQHDWNQHVRDNDPSWSLEARYRQNNGKYRWCLVRVESTVKEHGRDETEYWYGSMMDVDSLLRARQESDNRRNSILALVSNTHLCLWAVNQDLTLALQEGSLQWNPVTAKEQRDGEKNDVDQSDALVRAVTNSSDAIFEKMRDVLDGKLKTYTLDHREDGRWYRSTLIADRCSQGDDNGNNHDKTGPARSVLGLTIDVTDVRVRAELEMENESLTLKERAATEASQLKSRFVANVSILFSYSTAQVHPP